MRAASWRRVWSSRSYSSRRRSPVSVISSRACCWSATGPPRWEPIQKESSRGRSGRSLGREVGLPTNLPVKSTTSLRALVTSAARSVSSWRLSALSSSIQLTMATRKGASRTTSSTRNRCCPRVTMLLRSSSWLWHCRISAQQPTVAIVLLWGSQRTTPKRRSVSSTERSIMR